MVGAAAGAVVGAGAVVACGGRVAVAAPAVPAAPAALPELLELELLPPAGALVSTLTLTLRLKGPLRVAAISISTIAISAARPPAIISIMRWRSAAALRVGGVTLI